MLYNYISLLPFTVMMFWLAEFLFNPRESLRSMKFFVIFICLLAITDIILAEAIATPVNATFYYLRILDSYVTPLAMPIIYFHIRQLTVSQSTKWKYLLLIPSVVLGTTNLYFAVNMGCDEYIAHYTQALHSCTLTDHQAMLDSFRFICFDLYNATIDTMLIVLAVLILYDWRRHRNRLENYYANIEDKCIIYLRNFLLSGLAFILLSIILGALHRAYFRESPIATMLFFFGCACAQWGMCYNVHHIRFTTSDIDKDMKCNNTKKQAEEPAESASIDTTNIQNQLQQWLQRADKPFLKESLTLDMVAAESGVKARQISQFLNTVHHINFNTWINQQRVAEAKKLLLAPEMFTMLYIANTCGLADPAAFTRIFKKVEGVTPSEYRRRQNC